MNDNQLNEPKGPEKSMAHQDNLQKEMHMNNIQKEMYMNQDNSSRVNQEKKILPIQEWAPKVNEKRSLQDEEYARENPEEHKKQNYYKELKRIMPEETYISWGPESCPSVDTKHFIDPTIRSIKYDPGRKTLYLFVRGKTNHDRDWIEDKHLHYHEEAAELVYGGGTQVSVMRDINQ